MVEVIAILNVRPETAEETEKLLLPLIAGSRKDTGNISYDCNAVEGQKGTYVFHERWESQTVLNSHMKQPHFTAFSQAVSAYACGNMPVYVMGKTIL